MQKINWIPDEAARKAGINNVKLTGGMVSYNPKIGRYIRFAEKTPNGQPIGLRLDTRPELSALVEKLEAEEKKMQATIVTISLSSRGWGDYSPVGWIGDITRPDDEILTECRAALINGHDVDQRDQNDDEILTKIVQARAGWEMAPARKTAREAAEKEDIRNKIDSGYCFACESWCHGDCGHYSVDPMVKLRRKG